MFKHLARVSGALLAFACAAILVAPMANAATPKPGYEQFAGCPSAEENPAVGSCISSTITGGHFQMGNKNVPISNPMTLSGGVLPGGDLVANSKGGLSPVKQLVPGGIVGLTGLDWLVNFLHLEGLKLYAVTELVGGVNIAGETLELPIRVHLVNPVLGNKCYVGSPSNPIVLDLTLGTTSPPPPNEPISGTPPTFVFDPSKGIINANGAVFVDNAFAAPGASGCTLTLFGFIPVSINGLVNFQSGLPSAAGTNETVQNQDQQLVPRHLVYP